MHLPKAQTPPYGLPPTGYVRGLALLESCLVHPSTDKSSGQKSRASFFAQ